MNQEKIGLFISELRKEKNLTQKDLGDLLDITDNSVSKWESLFSIIILLCHSFYTLDISVFLPHQNSYSAYR